MFISIVIIIIIIIILTWITTKITHYISHSKSISIYLSAYLLSMYICRSHMITEAWEDKLNCRVCSGEITNQLEVCGCAMAAAAVESPIGTELQS